LHPEWENVTECSIANLRQAVGTDVDDPRFIELTGELTLASPRFRRLRARHEVRGQRGTPIRIDHPQVGEMTLNRERLAINGTRSLMLVVYHLDAGSSDADKPALLASAALPPRGRHTTTWGSRADDRDHRHRRGRQPARPRGDRERIRRRHRQLPRTADPDGSRR
jgi:hypothetical protein